MRKMPLWAAFAICGAALTACTGAGVAIGTGAIVARSVVQERSTKSALQDTEIQLSLNNRFLNHSRSLFADVATDVTEGRVLLTGTVPTRQEKISATRLAWETPGVKTVADELVVAEDSGTIAYIEDAWISNRIRLALLTDGDVRSVNFSVETVDKTVHLTGLARSREELRQVIEHARSIPGVFQVISHVLTIDDPRRIA